jgi:hypothetical protein
MTTTLPMVSATLPEPPFAGASVAPVVGDAETAATPTELVAAAAEVPLPLPVGLEEDPEEVTVVRVVCLLEDDEVSLPVVALLLVLDPAELLDVVGLSSLEPSVLTMMLP